MTRPTKASKPNIFVRMYRALGVPGDAYVGYLGDCFLIRVNNPDKATVHILIDFGILTGSAQAEARMRQIATDIIKTTGGEVDASGNVMKKGALDLLVITHEHWDHISGFSQAQDLMFDGLVIQKLWMAWTEDDHDATANQLRQEREQRSVALAALSERIQQATASLDPSPFAADQRVTLAGLNAFLGPLADNSAQTTADAFGAAASKTKRLKARDVMQALKKQALLTEFLSPGQVIQAPGQLKTFVLGPPRNLKRLKQDHPSSGPDQETYLANRALEDLLLRLADDGALGDDEDVPFSKQFQRIKPEDVRAVAAAQTAVDVSTDSGVLRWLSERYYLAQASDGRDQTRRTIDSDWLGAAGQLALKLDSDTNNTSLVLAFELPDGTFMLFPGDAQVGNWLSWHDQPYKDDARELSATQILGLVSFYKVAHHGSHNATLREKGLELMTHPLLVAAIPTDEPFGKRQGVKGWRMPDPNVQEAVLAATQGRTFRNDDALAASYSPFKHTLNATSLYLEYTAY